MENYFIGILVLVFGAVFSLFYKNQSLKLKFATLCAFIASCFTVFNGIEVFLKGTQSKTLAFIPVFQNIRFEIDYLSAFFVIFISIMSLLGIIYSNGYLKTYIEKGKDLSAHCVFLLLLFASMLGVVTCRNALFFLVVWEIMSLSSFFLVIFENEKKEVIKAGVKYLVFMHVSVVFIILTFAILAVLSSSLDFADFAPVLNTNLGAGVSLSNLVFILAFVGFGIKAGFIPFHNWLPEAHPAAPSHVSGIMSGVMIKTGIYGILRILALIGTPSVQIGYFVLILSVISALYGVIYAIGQHDLKRLLAYHSIENIGIIGIGIGVGMLGLSYNAPFVALLGFTGGILHILNHSIFKELLFLSAGSVYIKTHTRDIEILGGLIKKMPQTSVLFLIGSIAICGLPPFNGFISEFLIYFGMINSLSINNLFVLLEMILALSGLALVGTLAILCFTKAFSIVFLGETRSENAKNVKSDNGKTFIIPMSILACFTLLIGIFPKQVFEFVSMSASCFVVNADKIQDIAFNSSFNPLVAQSVESTLKINEITSIMQMISYVSIGLILFILVLFVLKLKLENKIAHNGTWGCGYNKPTSKMEYSASSYAEPFTTMLTPLFKKVSDIKKPKTVFPASAHFEQHIEDVEEVYFIKPLLKSIEDFFARFERFQNGNIQQYITYGLIFLVVSLIGVVMIG